MGALQHFCEEGTVMFGQRLSFFAEPTSILKSEDERFFCLLSSGLKTGMETEMGEAEASRVQQCW